MKNILIILFLANTLVINAQQVWDFVLDDLQNKSHNFESLKGEKLTVIDFWASWCKPCLKSMPKIEELFQNNKDRGVNFIGVNCDGPRSISKVAPLTKVLKIKYQVLTDINNVLMRDLEVTGLPTLLIIDDKNNIVYRHEGFSKGDEKEIQHKLDTLLGKTR